MEDTEDITPMYCTKCGRRYNVEGKLGIQPESIIGIILLAIIGLGFIKWRKNECPYCEGRLRRYKGQKLEIKHFAWAEAPTRTISAEEIELAEKKDTKNFIQTLKGAGIILLLFILFFIGRSLYYNFFVK